MTIKKVLQGVVDGGNGRLGVYVRADNRPSKLGELGKVILSVPHLQNGVDL